MEKQLKFRHIYVVDKKANPFREFLLYWQAVVIPFPGFWEHNPLIYIILYIYFWLNAN